jgi:hypothetical protein
LKIKAFAEMPIKKANLKIFINQTLTVAIGFVAVIPQLVEVWRSATKIMCISQAPLTSFQSKE